MKKKSRLKELEELISYEGQGLLNLSIELDDYMNHLMSKSLQRYFQLPIEAQLSIRMSKSISGKAPFKEGRSGPVVFQMSHGTQQIKRYEPEKYKNDRNTPLRVRTRTIVRLASCTPVVDLKSKLREMFKTYPYYLLKAEPINLRLKNFYFEEEPEHGILIRIYKATDPDNPNPETDNLYTEKDYSPKKTVKFQFTDDSEQYYYAVNTRNGRVSNVLRFVWGES